MRQAARVLHSAAGAMMLESVPTSVGKVAYNAAQAARISWFFGQKLLAARLSRPVPLPDALKGRPMPDRQKILADLWALLRQDWRNIEEGLYLPPEDGPANPLAALGQALDFFADLRDVEARRHGGGEGRKLDEPPPGRWPRYYLQPFHFQTGGYLSEASAARYDHQVEVLFGGGAAAMRRQALPPLRAALRGRQGARLLDIGCGTGRFLREVKRNHPRLEIVGLDLSPFYLAAARRELALWSRVRLVEGAAERLPFADNTFDAVTAVYLFHELPPAVRRAAAAEIRRVLKPCGRLVLVDSLQTGDEPSYDAMLDYFPLAFHEPYYASWIATDLDRLFEPGFSRAERFPAYFSKIASWRRDHY